MKTIHTNFSFLANNFIFISIYILQRKMKGFHLQVKLATDWKRGNSNNYSRDKGIYCQPMKPINLKKPLFPIKYFVRSK